MSLCRHLKVQTKFMFVAFIEDTYVLTCTNTVPFISNVQMDTNNQESINQIRTKKLTLEW